MCSQNFFSGESHSFTPHSFTFHDKKEESLSEVSFSREIKGNSSLQPKALSQRKECFGDDIGTYPYKGFQSPVMKVLAGHMDIFDLNSKAINWNTHRYRFTV